MKDSADFREDDFADVIEGLRADFAADPLPSSFRDGVLRKLDAAPRSGGRIQLIAAALFLVGLAVLAAFPWKPRPANPLAPAGTQDPGRLEDLRREIAGVKKEIRSLQEEIERLRTPPAPPSGGPTQSLRGRVTAVAVEIGLVVISLGKEDGVVEGTRFSIHRDGAFVAQIVIDRTDRKWSAGKILSKIKEPQVSDHVECSH